MGVFLLIRIAIGDDAEDQGRSVSFQRAWNEMESTGPSDQLLLEDSGHYWATMSFDLFRVFEQQAKELSGPAWCEYFVNQFGRHGAESDLRWLIMDVNYTIPFYDYGTSASTRDGLRANRIFRHIVIRCINEPRFRSRYVPTVLWSTVWRRQGESEGEALTSAMTRLGERFPDDHGAQDGEYWRCACIFVLLAYLTNREDLINEVDPSSLRQRFEDWRKWFVANRQRFVADPKSPRWVLGDEVRRITEDFELPAIKLPSRPFPDIGDRFPSPNQLFLLPSPSSHSDH